MQGATTLACEALQGILGGAQGTGLMRCAEPTHPKLDGSTRSTPFISANYKRRRLSLALGVLGPGEIDYVFIGER